MALSSFIVTTLQMGLDTLAKNPSGLVGQDALPIVESFVAATNLLAESAEEVGASYGDPTMRDGVFGYARQLRSQSEIMQGIMNSLESGQGHEDELRERLVSALRVVGDLTSQLVEIDEDYDQQALNNSALECASATKELVVKSLKTPKEVQDELRKFAAKATALVRALENIANKYEAMDPQSTERYRSVAKAVATTAPDLINSVRKAINGEGEEGGSSLVKHVQAVTSLIQQALNFGSGDRKKVQRIEIPPALRVNAAASGTRKRVKTIDASQGIEVLRRARTLTRNMDTRKEVEETMQATVPRASIPPDPEKERLKAEVEALKAENAQLRAKLHQILVLVQTP